MYNNKHFDNLETTIFTSILYFCTFPLDNIFLALTERLEILKVHTGARESQKAKKDE